MILKCQHTSISVGQEPLPRACWVLSSLLQLPCPFPGTSDRPTTQELRWSHLMQQEAPRPVSALWLMDRFSLSLYMLHFEYSPWYSPSCVFGKWHRGEGGGEEEQGWCREQGHLLRTKRRQELFTHSLPLPAARTAALHLSSRAVYVETVSRTTATISEFLPCAQFSAKYPFTSNTSEYERLLYCAC